MTYETKTAELPQGAISYLTAGEGAPLLVLHTSGGPLWTPLLEQLTAVRTVFMPVLPGFGGSAMLAGISSVQDLAGLAASFIETVLGGEAVDVFGGSFGGQVALYLAATAPHLIAEMVLEAPAGVAVGADPSAQDPEAARKHLFAHPEKASHLRPSPELAQSNSAAFRAYGGPVLVDEALVALVPSIPTPTLVVMGVLDRVTPPEAGQYLAPTMPSAKLTYIYDAAHAVQVDQADAMFRVTRHFLDKGMAFIVASRDYA